MSKPIDMILNCPSCGERHIEEGEFKTKPHHTHACQHCGMVWRPAVVPTRGVKFLPGFKDKRKKLHIDEGALSEALIEISEKAMIRYFKMSKLFNRSTLPSMRKAIIESMRDCKK